MDSGSPTELETERLLLRQWRAEDFERYSQFYRDAALSRYVGGLNDAEQAWRRLAAIIGHWTLRGYGYWAVEEKASGLLAGCIGFWYSPAWPEIELGYWLLGDMHGKGYAQEAGAASLQYGFRHLDCDSFVSYIHPDNTPSKQVAVRLGGIYETTRELLTFGPHCTYWYRRAERW